MVSPASTSTTSPTLRLGAGDELVAPCVAAGQQLGLGFGALAPQQLGLRLAAALGDGFGEIGEQHGEPQPEDDLELESQCFAPPVTRSRIRMTVVERR